MRRHDQTYRAGGAVYVLLFEMSEVSTRQKNVFAQRTDSSRRFCRLPLKITEAERATPLNPRAARLTATVMQSIWGADLWSSRAGRRFFSPRRQDVLPQFCQRAIALNDEQCRWPLRLFGARSAAQVRAPARQDLAEGVRNFAFCFLVTGGPWWCSWLSLEFEAAWARLE